MNLTSIKYELQHILSGKSGISYDAIIQAVARHLRTSQRASPMAEEKHQNKAKETEKLITFAQKNHDYYHPELGIILEDLHDENVLTQNGILYFIDTVFYIKPEVFWK